MKTTKKVTPKRKPTLTGKATKQDLVDLEYWKSVAKIITEQNGNGDIEIRVGGFTYRNSAMFLVVKKEYKDGKYIDVSFDSFHLNGVMATILLKLNKYYNACEKIEEVISQFGW